MERARRLAKRRGKSLNEMIRDYLKGLTEPMSPEEAAARLEDLWRISPGHSDGETWTREELNVRPRFR